MSRERAELVYESGATVLKLKVSELFDWLPEDVQRELVSMAVTNGELLSRLAHDIASNDTPSDGLPESPRSDWYLGYGVCEKLRIALAPLAGPGVQESIEQAVAERDRLKPAVELLRVLVRARLGMEADKATRGEVTEWNFKVYQRAWADAEKWFLAQPGATDPRPKMVPALPQGGGR